MCLVYTTNRAVLADGVGRRLENFFWRIWSNGQICNTITGSQVAAQFSSISEGGPLRTTPTQSPRSKSSITTPRQDEYSAEPSSHPSSHRFVSEPRFSSLPGGEQYANTSTSRNLASSAPRITSPTKEKKSTSRPPPILKKPRTGFPTQSPKTARILSPTLQSNYQGADDRVEDSGNSPLEKPSISFRADLESQHLEPAQPSSPSRRPKADHSDKVTPSSRAGGLKPVKAQSERKKPVFLANTAATKRRPPVTRRKSSQSSSSNASKGASPCLTDQATSSLGSPPPLPSLTPAPNAKERGSLSQGRLGDVLEPSLSSETVMHPTEQRSAKPFVSTDKYASRSKRSVLKDTMKSSRGEEEDQQDWLVDRNFRTKFADKTSSRNVSFASLPSLVPKPTTAVATSAPYAARGPMDFKREAPSTGKGKDTQMEYTNELVPLKPPGASSSAVEDSDSSPPVSSQTKSQLTLLLESERAKPSSKHRKTSG